MRRLLPLAVVILALTSCAPSGPANAPGDPQASPSGEGPRFDDFDPHPWQGKPPWRYPVHGIDVARYQDSLDWRAVRQSGIRFAFVKATEGGDLLDPMFHDHWRGARRAGLPVGAYHYFYFCRPAEEQARWFIANVPRSRASLPHVLDMEWNPTSPTCRKRPDGATVRAEAKVFLDMLERYYRRRPVLYTTVDFYRDTDIGRLANTEFWLRSVADHPAQVYSGQRWTFWQYTGTGRVPGASGPIDINVFSGSLSDWDAWSR